MTILMSQTLPTIVAMGVVSEATKTMFGKRGTTTSRTRKGTRKASIVVLKVTLKKSEAVAAAAKLRKTRKGKIMVKKAPGGWMVVWYK